MKIKKRLILALLVLFCVSITPIMLVEEVSAASKSYEYQVLDLVNAERVKVGASPLKMDKDLFEAARLRSKELQIKFSHDRPDGSSCFTVSPKASGENIAYGQATPQSVMNSWMNSQGHKANILDPSFKSIGIGYLQGTPSYWVQLFGRGEADERLESDLIITTSYEIDNRDKQKTSKEETPKQETPKEETPEQDTFKQEIPKEETSKQDTFKQEIPKEETSKQETPKDGTFKQDTFKQETPKEETLKQQNNNKGQVKKLNPPSFSLTSDNKKIIIKWKKVSKAKGYQIYKSTRKNGKYVLKKTITKGSTIKYTDKNLKKKQKYYYKIRSYTINNGKKVYSKFSSVKSKTAK